VKLRLKVALSNAVQRTSLCDVKVPLDDEEALVTDSCYTQYDEKVDPPANDFEYDQVKAQLPGIEPPPVVEPQYINTKNQDDFPYMHM